MRPRLLDLYCAGGGASAGYAKAGFQVVGVDILPQPRYPFQFIQADALEFLARRGEEFDVIAASPPCFLNSTLQALLPDRTRHQHHIGATRRLLLDLGKPYVIENVPGAILRDPVTYCGSMFGLGTRCADGEWRQLRRHRLFESSMVLVPPGPCVHEGQSLGVHGGGPQVRKPRAEEGRGGYQSLAEERRRAMGIDWLHRNEVSLAIPPAYTRHVGRQVLDHLATIAMTKEVT